jgi:hypothetical protein
MNQMPNISLEAEAKRKDFYESNDFFILKSGSKLSMPQLISGSMEFTHLATQHESRLSPLISDLDKFYI